jgi:hypothetical protein
MNSHSSPAKNRPSKLPRLYFRFFIWENYQSLYGWPRTRPSGRCSFSAPQEVVRVLRLSGRLAAQLINYLPYICKFDSSIDSTTQGLPTASLAARRNQLPLYRDTKHVAQGAPFVLSIERIRFKPLDPFV